MKKQGIIKIPYCEKNEKIAKNFLNKIKELTQNKLRFNILWQSKKLKTLFKVKDKIVHQANAIYKGTSVGNPDVTYIGETSQITTLRWNQHANSSSKLLKRKSRGQLYVGNLDDIFSKLAQEKDP